MSYSARPIQVSSTAEDISNASLRAVLKDVPMLPPPVNVEELLARLDLAEPSLDSGPFSALVSDAYAVDPADEAPLSNALPQDAPVDDDFFAPVAHAANSNIPQPVPSLASRLAPVLGHLARAGVIAGTLFVFSASVLIPEPAPTPPPARLVVSLPEEPAPELAVLAEAKVQKRVDATEKAEAMLPVEYAAQLDQAADVVADIDADRIEHAPEPPRVPAWVEPEAGASEVEATVPVADEETAGVALPPAFETAGTDLSAPEIASAEVDDAAEVDGAGTDRLTSAPRPPARPSGLTTVPFAGTWAESAAACAPQMRDQGYLLTRINAQRGSAGGTTCRFADIQPNGANRWAIAAVCSNGRRTWKSDVRLTLSRGRLTWTSQKGTTTYVRCQAA